MTEEKKADQWGIIHALKGDHNKIGHCKEKCGDSLCDYGCLRRNAQIHYRASIMHAIAILRDLGSDEYPLNAGAYLDPRQECPGGNLGQVGSSKKICRDPVCRVTGCLYKPAHKFRELIKLDHDYQLFKALKK